MKTNKGFLKGYHFYFFVVILVLFLINTFETASYGSIIWSDDFESYSAGSFPGTPWSFSGNSDIYVDDSISIQGNKSLRTYGRLGGCWEALAHRSIGVSTSEGFTVEFYVNNGSDYQPGCHEKQATMTLNTVDSWTAYGYYVIYFSDDGTIRDRNDDSLGTWTQLSWYKVKITYGRDGGSTVNLSYWIDDIFKGTASFSREAFEGSLSYFSFASGDGTAWFDDIEVYTGGNTSTTTTTPEIATTTTAICPSEQIYGEHSEQTELLRYFRDNVLTRTPEGQEIIRLYYELSPVIVQVMEEDETFKEEVQEMIEGILLLVTGAAE